MEVLSFHFLKPCDMSEREIWWWRGDDSTLDDLRSSDKYIFWREVNGRCVRSALPSKRELPNGVRLSCPSNSLSGCMVKGVPWA